MHIRDQRNSNNFHGYKKIDLIISSNPNKCIAKRVTSYGSPRDHCIENQTRERGSHLATHYGPVGLQRTTHASSERHQWTCCTPPWWCLDWIWWFWTLRRLELIFVDSPRVCRILGYYRATRWSGGHPRWALPTRTRLGLLARPGGLCSPRSTPRRCLVGPLGVFWSIKNLHKVSLHLDSVWYWFPVI